MIATKNSIKRGTFLKEISIFLTHYEFTKENGRHFILSITSYLNRVQLYNFFINSSFLRIRPKRFLAKLGKRPQKGV